MADLKQSSPYINTPIKDFYRDLWVPRDIPPRSDDELLEIPTKYDKRPDLMAYDRYGSARLYWVFARRNMDILIDPIEDFTAGTKIMVPVSLEGGT